MVRDRSYATTSHNRERQLPAGAVRQRLLPKKWCRDFGKFRSHHETSRICQGRNHWGFEVGFQGKTLYSVLLTQEESPTERASQLDSLNDGRGRLKSWLVDAATHTYIETFAPMRIRRRD